MRLLGIVKNWFLKIKGKQFRGKIMKIKFIPRFITIHSLTNPRLDSYPNKLREQNSMMALLFTSMFAQPLYPQPAEPTRTMISCPFFFQPTISATAQEKCSPAAEMVGEKALQQFIASQISRIRNPEASPFPILVSKFRILFSFWQMALKFLNGCSPLLQLLLQNFPGSQKNLFQQHDDSEIPHSEIYLRAARISSTFTSKQGSTRPFRHSTMFCPDRVIFSSRAIEAALLRT